MTKKQKLRSDEDYQRLDDAFGVLLDWQGEIQRALYAKGLSEKPLSQVMQAIREVHSPEEAM
jgi:hypothetical protein